MQFTHKADFFFSPTRFFFSALVREYDPRVGLASLVSVAICRSSWPVLFDKWLQKLWPVGHVCKSEEEQNIRIEKLYNRERNIAHIDSCLVILRQMAETFLYGPSHLTLLKFGGPNGSGRIHGKAGKW
uniref:Uncharacterized protein n=1 Tax=Candidozyma auris TaxID=498019 RepID=A0A0L0P487_CANAR